MAEKKNETVNETVQPVKTKRTLRQEEDAKRQAWISRKIRVLQERSGAKYEAAAARVVENNQKGAK